MSLKEGRCCRLKAALLLIGYLFVAQRLDGVEARGFEGRD